MILMGSDYWDGLIKWITEKMLNECKFILPNDMKVFTVVDKPEEAIKIILDFKESQGRIGIELPPGMKKT